MGANLGCENSVFAFLFMQTSPGDDVLYVKRLTAFFENAVYNMGGKKQQQPQSSSSSSR